MPRAWSPCTQCRTPCPPGQGRCDGCIREAERARHADPLNQYSRAAHRRFREAVLARDPICKVCGQAWSTVADHYPLSRRDLVARGLDDSDPSCGRGLCHTCHSRETARLQPGGWNQR